MKFKINQDTLLENLNYVIKGVSSKNLIPVLACIKFEINEEGITMLSTDNEVSISVLIKKERISSIEGKGKFIVNGRLFHEIVRKLPNIIINVELTENNKVILSTISSSFTLNTSDINDFPILDFDESKEKLILDGKILKNIFSKTLFSVSLSETRPVLTGLNLQVKKDKLIATTTDSYRMSKYIVDISNDYETNIIIPAKSVNEINKMVKEDKPVEIYLFNNKIIVKIENVKFVSRLINGNYPNTEQLLPTETIINIKVNLNDFYNSIDRASLFTSELDKNTIKFQTFGNTIKINSNTQEVGNIEENVNCENLNGMDIKIAFSSRFMLEALKSFDCEGIILKFNGEVKPILVESDTDNGNIQFILPIRTY